MAVNPDPKPGRWILPLVVLGMIAFTYFFVRELPEASTATTLVSSPGDATTTTGEGNGDDTTSTTRAQTSVDPETQAYLDEIDAINEELQLQRTEILTVNDAFNEDPRGIEFPEAEDRFEAIETALQGMVERLAAVTPPEALASNHASLESTLNLASDSISEALAGLRSTDTGEQRNSAVDAFTTAASNYDTEVTNTFNAAGASG